MSSLYKKALAKTSENKKKVETEQAHTNAELDWAQSTEKNNRKRYFNVELEWAKLEYHVGRKECRRLRALSRKEGGDQCRDDHTPSGTH